MWGILILEWSVFECLIGLWNVKKNVVYINLYKPLFALFKIDIHIWGLLDNRDATMCLDKIFLYLQKNYAFYENVQCESFKFTKDLSLFLNIWNHSIIFGNIFSLVKYIFAYIYFKWQTGDKFATCNIHTKIWANDNKKKT